MPREESGPASTMTYFGDHLTCRMRCDKAGGQAANAGYLVDSRDSGASRVATRFGQWVPYFSGGGESAIIGSKEGFPRL